jgi:hypothetical protein
MNYEFAKRENPMPTGDATDQPYKTAVKANQTQQKSWSHSDISTATILKITKLNDEQATNKDEAIGIMSVIGSGDDIYTSVGKFLAEHDASLEESFGSAFKGNAIGCSFFIFRTKKATITRMIQEIEMNQIDEISIAPEMRQSEIKKKTYEMRITAKNRKWILHEIMQILESYARIITPRVKTSEPFRLESGEEIEIVHIYLKFEISSDQAGRLGAIMDRIRGIGQQGFFNVDEPREIKSSIGEALSQLKG